MPLFAFALLLVGSCGPTESTDTKEAPAKEDGAIATASSSPTPLDRTASALRDWKSIDRAIALQYPAYLAPTTDFPGTYFTAGGWRIMFDGTPAGPGKGLVRFSADAFLKGDVPRSATESLQIGISDDPSVVRGCLTDGLEGGNGAKRPDRLIGGVPFTVYTNGDAGMSHQLSTVDLRALHNGRCIAIDLLTISVPASVEANTVPQRSAAEVSHDFDTILSSITLR